MDRVEVVGTIHLIPALPVEQSMRRWRWQVLVVVGAVVTAAGVVGRVVVQIVGQALEGVVGHHVGQIVGVEGQEDVEGIRGGSEKRALMSAQNRNLSEFKRLNIEHYTFLSHFICVNSDNVDRLVPS